MHDVFISFSFKDQQVADKIVNHLTNLYGISCWICTEEIRAGENFRKDIAEAIKNSRFVVFVQSKLSVSSTEVSKELLFALKKGKMVKPFMIEESQLSDEVELELSTTHYIDATIPTLDERIKDLAKDICRSLGKPFVENDLEVQQSIKERLLSTPSVIPKTIFCGREDVLFEIDEKFKKGERILFLCGIGGIGKTQIAKQYIKQHEKDYETIIYATYNGSIRELILSESPFSFEPEMLRYTLSDGAKEDDDSFFERKLDKIKKLSSERTLIVLDNFDVENDGCLTELMDGNYRLLITTRCDYSRYYPTVKIQAIESMDHLKDIFMQNYNGFDVEEDDPALVRLIELVNRHTYTIELLAQHMENSGQTAEEMIDALENEGILSLNEEIYNSDMKAQIAYENLLKMFKIFSLTEEERQVLMYLSLMPIEGVEAKNFRAWANLKSNKLLINLENRSWIIRNTNGIALHPIIKEVVKHENPADKDNCLDFLQEIINHSISVRNSIKRQNMIADKRSNTMELYKAILQNISIDPQYALYYDLSCAYAYGLFDNAYYEAAAALFYELRNYAQSLSQRLNCYEKTAQCYVLSGNGKSAQKVALEAWREVENLDSAKFTLQIGRFYTGLLHRLIESHRSLGLYDEALNYGKVCFETCRHFYEIYENDSFAWTKYHVGRTLMLKGDSAEESEKILKEALVIFELNHDTLAIGCCMDILALVYKQKDLFSDALNYNQKAFDLLSGLFGVSIDLANNRRWRGDIFVQLEHFNEARECYLTAITMYRERNCKIYLEETLNVLNSINNR